MTAFDLHTDPTFSELYRLTEVYDPPEFVKAAGLDELTRDVPSNAYADDVGRRLACHSAPATVVAAMYYFDEPTKYGSASSRIADRIRTVADRLGVGGAVAEIERKAAASRVPVKLPREVYAYQATWEDGREDLRLPIRSHAEAQSATDYLRKYAFDFRYVDRSAIAGRILGRPQSLGLSEEDKVFLEKTAGLGTGTAEQAAQLVLQRAFSVDPHKQADARQDLAALAEVCVENPKQAIKPEFRRKLASLLDDFDREHRLTDTTPPDELFSITPTGAAVLAASTVKSATGDVYRKTDLLSVDPTPVFGEDRFGLVPTEEKAAAFITSLNRPSAALFARLAAQHGVKPLWTEAA